MKFYLLISSILFSSFCVTETWLISPSSNSQEEIQEALILAEPGDVIELSEGFYELKHGLSLDIDDVSIIGAGQDKTILNFQNQVSSAQGLLVTSDRVLLKDFAIEDAKGDAVKSKGSDQISFINLRTEWTNGPDSNNGAYGIYPVESKKVLIDGCIAIGASDAGIYVGQSEQIIVRNTLAKFNVAGIEIENSYYADVYNNIATNNTGGILVFDLPNLPKQGGKFVRVFNNKSFDNNTSNFAPEGNIVGEVPSGTGLVIMANSHVEVFDNEFSDNSTIHIAVVSGDLESGDENYYPHPKSIQIHNNSYSNVGYAPDIERGDLSKLLVEIADGEMPDVIWDGVLPLSQALLGQPSDEKLILNESSSIKFLNLDALWYFLFSYFHSPNSDKTDFSGDIIALPEVKEW